MKSEDIKPYIHKNFATLEKLAVKHFNAWIRYRDSQVIKDGFICISCRNLKPVAKMHAGHFYSSGHYPILRFDEDNVHGQCHRCNTHLHGNLNEYRQHLERKIGRVKLETLDLKSKANGHRIDRWTLIEIILTYKTKLKNHVEKDSFYDSISDDTGYAGSIQPKRGKLFQFTGGGQPTRTQVWRQEDPEEEKQAKPKATPKEWNRSGKRH